MGSAGDLRTPATPPIWRLYLTGADPNLTPLSQALRKTGYRGVRQVEPVLPQLAVNNTPNFGNRLPRNRERQQFRSPSKRLKVF